MEHRPVRVCAGETVEISIAYASDWATQGIGVFLDDITLPDGTSTSFESGLDGWAITGPPAGSAPNANNFIRTDAAGFPVGNAIATPHSLLLGSTGGRLDCRRTQRSDGPSARPPAGLGGVRHVRSLRAGSAPNAGPARLAH